VESASPAFADHPTLRDLVRFDIPASGSSDADQNGKDRWVIDPTANIEPQKQELYFFICRNTTIAFALDQEGVGPQRQKFRCSETLNGTATRSNHFNSQKTRSFLFTGL